MATEQQRSPRLAPTQNDAWDDRLARVRQDGEPVVIEEGGRPVAALVSVDDYRRLLRIDAARRRLFVSIDRMQDAFADVPLDEIEREVAHAVAKIRQADRINVGRSSSS